MGNCEARDILSGDFDAVICDGFDGNIVLKYTEGLADALLSMLKAELMADMDRIENLDLGGYDGIEERINGEFARSVDGLKQASAKK